MSSTSSHINPAKSNRPSVADLQPRAVNPDAGHTLLTRRRFLYGAVGVGVVAAAGAGVALMSTRGDDEEEVTYLEVPESAVTAQTEMENIEDWSTCVQLAATADLPYGTLVWANSDAVAACLVPTNVGSPLAEIGVLALGSGSLVTVLEEAVGTKEGFEIYDVRAVEAGIVWTEADVLDGAWRIYTATLDGNLVAGEPIMVDQGDGTWDTPMLAAAGSYAFWQVLPKLPNDDALPSYFKRARFGAREHQVVLENARRMATPPYATEDAMVVTPRLDSPTVYYQLTCFDAASLAVRDTLVLPAGMKPLEAGYGVNGFSFVFDSIYSYGDGIANLGTYTPKRPVQPGGDYSAARWFSFARTPMTAPAWAGDIFVVKSTRAVCGVDLASEQYYAIDVDDGADTYGEFLASTGAHRTFVTFTNIDHTPIEGQATKACRVKVWQPVGQEAPEEDGDDGSLGEESGDAASGEPSAAGAEGDDADGAAGDASGTEAGPAPEPEPEPLEEEAGGVFA